MDFAQDLFHKNEMSIGMDVIDVNILPTPSVGILVRELEAAGGIVLNSFNKEFPSATFDSTEGLKSFSRRPGFS